MKYSSIIFWLLALLSGLAPRSAQAANGRPGERTFVKGLVERRLFELAQLECRQQLADPELSDRDRVDWTVELIRILGRHAANQVPTERPARWQAAHEAASEFLAQSASRPRRVLVQVQDALTSLAEGELARMEAEVAARPQAALDRARTTIRQATRALEQLDGQLTEQIARAGDRSRDPELLSADELFSLQSNVRFQAARAFRNQALCYPPASDDRVASLSMAVQQLERTGRQINAEDPLAWQVYLDQAICYRLLGNSERARRALSAPLGKTAPVAVRLRAEAEQVRLELAAGHPERALEKLNQTRASIKVDSPELDFAQFETYLAFWQAATQKKDATAVAKWQQKATAAVAYLERKYGPYWGRRAELQLLRVAGSGAGTGNLDILERVADNLCRKGQFDDAVTAYLRAARQAHKSGAAEAAFDLEFKAALVEQEMGKFEAAFQRLRALCMQHSSSAKAPQRHLTAAWNAAQVTRDNPRFADQYAAVLEEHLAQWPESPTANTARRWLGRLRELQKNWPAAVAAYRKVTPDSEHFEPSLKALSRCWNLWLKQEADAGRATDKIADDAMRFFDGVILGPDRRWPERWTAAQREAALATTRLRLEYARDGYVDAEKVLRAALQNDADAPAPWRETAQSLLVVAVAGQPARQEEAQRMLEASSAGSADRLLELIDALSTLAAGAPRHLRGPLAKLQLTALDRLEHGRAELDPRQRRRVDQVRAQALRAAGRRDEALAVLTRLADAHPNNGPIQMERAQLLLDGDDPESLAQAARRWQEIGRKVRPGTSDWYRTRYSVALALFKQEKKKAAAQKLRYLKATSNVDATLWKSKVDGLLGRCGSGD